MRPNDSQLLSFVQPRHEDYNRIAGACGFHAVLLWPLFAFYGLFLAATEGAEKALVADLAPRNQLGTAYGWFNLTAGFMLLPASILFGWLWQGVAVEAAFGFSAACALRAALLLEFWVMRAQPAGGPAYPPATGKE